MHPRPRPVPAKYASVYQQTSRDLDAYAGAIDAMPAFSKKALGSRAGFVDLLIANGNRQTALLRTGTMTLVDQSLDAFKRLGIGGVVLAVKLPLLLPQYTAQAKEFTQFFAAVAKHAHARGFKVDVELGPLFCGTVYSQCSYDYPATVAGWAQLTAEQARTVIDNVHPDDLDLISEPDTEATLTGIRDLASIDGLRAFVSETVTTIGSHGATKLFAGAASWFPVSYDRALLGTGIDGLVTHIYPATAGTAANLVAVSRLAHDAGKPLIADEVWLWKGKASASGVEASSAAGRTQLLLVLAAPRRPVRAGDAQVGREGGRPARLGLLVVGGLRLLDLDTGARRRDVAPDSNGDLRRRREVDATADADEDRPSPRRQVTEPRRRRPGRRSRRRRDRRRPAA